ncbi:MAG: pilus assembly protein PilM, partial [Planctomycetes bacterium]|nr:pilus assembly protein PilM [Planctomycetota bacterium]
HLLCMSGDTLWIRSLPIAGNTFTQVVQEALGISYEEAEQEKRNARKSPRAKEIAEAIRQPMSRFIEEVQRSLGYFRSLHPETRVTSMLALGEGFKLPGLARYLQEAAGLEIHGLSSLENFDLSQARNLKHFKQHAASFAAALGMAAQALGISGALDTTLLPPEVLRERLLARKKPYVAAAAAVVLGLVVALFAVEKGENSRLRSEHETVFTPAKTEIGRIEERRRRYSTISSQAELRGLQEVDSIFEDRIVDRRGLWHQIFSELIKPIPREPANEHIWLTAVGSSYVGLRQAAASLVELPPELMAARPGGRRSDWMESRLRTGRVAEGPEGLLVMPEQVLSVVVMGEAKHPERAAFVDREFVSKLNESPVFSFAKMVYSELEVRWVDSAGRVVGVVVEGRPDTGVPMSGRAALEDLRKVEYTQFVVRVFVDLEGKLAAAVEEERKRLTEAARMGPQP